MRPRSSRSIVFNFVRVQLKSERDDNHNGYDNGRVWRGKERETGGKSSKVNRLNFYNGQGRSRKGQGS